MVALKRLAAAKAGNRARAIVARGGVSAPVGLRGAEARRHNGAAA